MTQVNDEQIGNTEEEHAYAKELFKLKNDELREQLGMVGVEYPEAATKRELVKLMVEHTVAPPAEDNVDNQEQTEGEGFKTLEGEELKQAQEDLEKHQAEAAKREAEGELKAIEESNVADPDAQATIDINTANAVQAIELEKKEAEDKIKEIEQTERDAEKHKAMIADQQQTIERLEAEAAEREKVTTATPPTRTEAEDATLVDRITDKVLSALGESNRSFLEQVRGAAQAERNTDLEKRVAELERRNTMADEKRDREATAFGSTPFGEKTPGM